MNRLGTEAAFDVFAQVLALRAQGKNVISFCVGEPDFDTPQNIKNTGINAIKNNKTHYSPVPGLIEMRKAVAQHISNTRKIKTTPKEVIITPGGKPGIFFGIMSLVEKEDEVIYPNPGYPIYESVINFAGATPIPLPMLEEKGFSFDITDLKALITNKTKLIILNSPSNPTGGIIPKNDLEELAKICIEKNIWVLSDEIYSKIIYEGEFNSIYSIKGMKERTILLDGHSKTFAMTGWRLGYMIAPKEIAEHFSKFMNNVNTSTCTFTQIAGIEALNGSQTEPQKMVQEFKTRRDLTVKLLNEIPGIKCHTPKGAFYAFPNVTRACKENGFSDSRELQNFLLYKAGVGVLARTCFGTKNKNEKEEYIRLSYATSQNDIHEGIKRIKEALANKELVKEFLEEKKTI
jgi:aspartate aminotransferase